MNKTERLEQKNQRYYDAIALKEPDRVPIAPFSTFYSALQAGLNQKEAMYKPRKFANVSLKIFSQYDWDQYPVIFIVCLGKFYDRVGLKQMKWPGAADPDHCLSDNQPFQYIEKFWMEPAEYETLLQNPTDFLLQTIVPAQLAAFDAMKKFPNPYELIGFLGGMFLTSFYLDKDVKKMIKKARRSLPTLINLALALRKYEKGLNKNGNPMLQLSGLGMAPFDVISDMLRGMRGTMMDMYRNPEELKKTCELFVRYEMETLTKDNPLFSKKGVVFIPLHRGADGFMSNKQFEEFYWPTLAEVMEKMILKGMIPMPFFEGSYNDRLEYLEEFAKKHSGKAIYWFDKTDIAEVKRRMGNHVCIKGNIPASLLIAGPPSKVKEYVRRSLEDCMDGGGFIVDGGVSGIPDEAKHENVKAMTDAVHEYGVYRK